MTFVPCRTKSTVDTQKGGEQRTLKQPSAHLGDEMNRRSGWAQREAKADPKYAQEDPKYAGREDANSARSGRKGFDLPVAPETAMTRQLRPISPHHGEVGSVDPDVGS